MRVDPVDIVIDRNFKFHKKIFLISGNEITLMNKMCDLFKNKVKESGDYSIEKIKNIASINQDGGLFNNYKFCSQRSFGFR